VKVTGCWGVPPSGVGAVVLNVTAVDASRATFVTVWPSGVSRPKASTLNPAAGGVSANEIIAKVGSNGQVSIYNHNGEVDLLFDVVGYLPSTSDYVPLTPARVLDTRVGDGVGEKSVGAS
jgi:hypothetical protein